jgi:hypothetical protein
MRFFSVKEYGMDAPFGGVVQLRGGESIETCKSCRDGKAPREH